MQPASMTPASEGSGMATGSSMAEGADMRPGRGGSYQYPAGGSVTPASPSGYQQTPSTATGTTSTATPGYTSTDQSSRRSSGDWESSTTAAATGRDTSKTTQQTEHKRTRYGPWLPAFMCTLVLLIVLFLVPYIFLSSPKPSTGPQPPAGHVGAQCSNSSPCKGKGNCVGGTCKCDLPGTRVVAGVCVSVPTTTTELPTTEPAETESSDTPAPDTTISELPTTEAPEAESTTYTVPVSTVSERPTAQTSKTEASHSVAVTTPDARTRTGTTMPPSVMFTYVHTVRLTKRRKNRALVKTTGIARKVKPGGKFTKRTKRLLKSAKQRVKHLVSSSKMSNSTGTSKRRARRE
ncbi:hypothetical protein V5799_027874 [Amblyomma americanum]|uniref:Uncharacterized protein n=1 Tax=Amblyomma americanum TaxID=6943 RepID=A0AAQ4DEG7_AMBAM